MKKINDYLTTPDLLCQLAEEASELAQAALKLKRAMEGTNPTPKSVEECVENWTRRLPMCPFWWISWDTPKGSICCPRAVLRIGRQNVG